MRPKEEGGDVPVDGVYDGTVYSVLGEPNAEVVVFIHGVGMDRTIWAPQQSAFSALYRVVTYDMLGHGGSVLPQSDPALGNYATQLAALLSHLNVARAHIVGHSMGALVALEFILCYPERVVSVCALNAVYDRTPAQRAAVMQRAAELDEGSGGNVSVDATLARWFDTPVPTHLQGAADVVMHLLESADPVGYARTYRLFARSDRAHVGRLQEIQAPALFMTGEMDFNSSPEMSRAMAADIRFGTVCVVPNQRHMMNVTAAADVNQRLLAFLQNGT